MPRLKTIIEHKVEDTIVSTNFSKYLTLDNTYMVLAILAVVVVLLIIFGHFIQKKEKEKVNNLKEELDTLIKNSNTVIEDWENIRESCITLKQTLGVYNRIKTLIHYNGKYKNVLNETDLGLLIDGVYFVGMTEEMVLERIGQPTKIEDEVMKTKTKRTYIYGNKSSGDVLVFENGKLVRFKDR